MMNGCTELPHLATPTISSSEALKQLSFTTPQPGSPLSTMSSPKSSPEFLYTTPSPPGLSGNSDNCEFCNCVLV